MSVSLREVIESAGYDLSTVDDARWLISQESDWDELLEQAEELVEEAENAELEEDDE